MRFLFHSCRRRCVYPFLCSQTTRIDRKTGPPSSAHATYTTLSAHHCRHGPRNTGRTLTICGPRPRLHIVYADSLSGRPDYYKNTLEGNAIRDSCVSAWLIYFRGMAGPPYSERTIFKFERARHLRQSYVGEGARRGKRPRVAKRSTRIRTDA